MVPAHVDPLPSAYLGRWCGVLGGEGKYVLAGTEKEWQTCRGRGFDGDGYIEITRDGFEDCKFVFIKYMSKTEIIIRWLGRADLYPCRSRNPQDSKHYTGSEKAPLPSDAHSAVTQKISLVRAFDFKGRGRTIFSPCAVKRPLSFG
jgi:hypothetical protein